MYDSKGMGFCFELDFMFVTSVLSYISCLWLPTKMLLLENPSYKHEIKLKTLVNRHQTLAVIHECG